jgi:putative redox protein
MAQVTVTGTSDSQYETRITNGRHTIIADEPEPIGTDLGPNPYDFLLSALGACTSITVFMYAGRRGWPLERIHIELEHDRVHADDLEQCEGDEGLVDLIERKIRFEGPLDVEQRERLAYIATRCPVHKTLTTPTVIVDEIVQT